MNSGAYSVCKSDQVLLFSFPCLMLFVPQILKQLGQIWHMNVSSTADAYKVTASAFLFHRQKFMGEKRFISHSKLFKM